MPHLPGTSCPHPLVPTERKMGKGESPMAPTSTQGDACQELGGIGIGVPVRLLWDPPKQRHHGAGRPSTLPGKEKGLLFCCL